MAAPDYENDLDAFKKNAKQILAAIKNEKRPIREGADLVFSWAERAPHLKPDHQKFWYDTMLRETAAALLGRSAATEDEAQQGAALLRHIVEFMPAAIKADNVSIASLGFVLFDPARKFFASLAADWLPAADAAAMSAHPEPETQGWLSTLRVGDRFHVALNDGTWATSEWAGFSEKRPGSFLVYLPGRTTATRLDFTPSLFAPAGRGPHRLADLRGMARRHLGGCADDAVEALVAGEEWRASLCIGDVIDARTVRGDWYMGLVVDERTVPIAALFAGCHVDGSEQTDARLAYDLLEQAQASRAASVGEESAAAAAAAGDAEDVGLTPVPSVTQFAEAAAAAAGHTDPWDTVREVRVSFLGGDEDDDMWYPVSSPFICRPKLRSAGATLATVDDGLAVFPAQWSVTDDQAVPVSNAAQGEPVADMATHAVMLEAAEAVRQRTAEVTAEVKAGLSASSDSAAEDAIAAALDSDEALAAATTELRQAQRVWFVRRRPLAVGKHYFSVLGHFAKSMSGLSTIVMRLEAAVPKPGSAASAGEEGGGQGAAGAAAAEAELAYTPLSPGHLRVITATLVHMMHGLSLAACSESYPRAISASVAIIESWTDEQMKSLASTELIVIANSLAQLQCAVSDFDEASALRERVLLSAARRYSHSKLQRRMEALRIFGDLADMAMHRETLPLGFRYHSKSKPSTDPATDLLLITESKEPDPTGLTWLTMNSDWAQGRSYCRVTVARSVTTAEVLAAVTEEDVLRGALVERPHAQLVKRCGDLVRFLSRNGVLPSATIEAAWDLAERSGGSDWRHLLDLLSEVASDVHWRHLALFLRKLRELPGSSLDDGVVGLLFAIATTPRVVVADPEDLDGLSVLEALESSDESDDDTTSDRQCAAARLALAMLVSLTHDGLDARLWPVASLGGAASSSSATSSSGGAAAAAAAAAAATATATATAAAAASAGAAAERAGATQGAPAPAEASAAAALRASAAMASARLEPMRQVYLDRCVGALKSGRSVAQALELLGKLIGTFPKLASSADDDARPTQASVIADLEAKHGLISALLADMGRLRQAALETALAKGFSPLCSASNDDLGSWQDEPHATDDAAAAAEAEYNLSTDPINSLRVSTSGSASSATTATACFLLSWDSRMRCLRLVLEQSELLLSTEQVVGLWETTVVGALSLGQRSSALHWFEEAIAPLFTAGEALSTLGLFFLGDVVERLFADELVRPWFAPSATVAAFRLVNSAFLFVNSTKGLLSATESSVTVLSRDLEGTDVIWGIALRSGSERAASSAMSSLMQLIGSLAPEARADAPKLAQGYIHRCMRYIRSVLPSTTDVGPGLPDSGEADKGSLSASPSRVRSAASATTDAAAVSFAIDPAAGKDEERVRSDLARAQRVVGRCVGVLTTLVTSTSGPVFGLLPPLVQMRGHVVEFPVFGKVTIDGVPTNIKDTSVRGYAFESVGSFIVGIASSIGVAARAIALMAVPSTSDSYFLCDEHMGSSLMALGLCDGVRLAIMDKEHAATLSSKKDEALGASLATSAAAAAGTTLNVVALSSEIDECPAAVIATTPAFIGTLLGVLDASAAGEGNTAPPLPLPNDVLTSTRMLVEALPAGLQEQARVRQLNPKASADGHALSRHAARAAAAVELRVHLSLMAAEGGADLEEWAEADTSNAILASIGVCSTGGVDPAVEAVALGFSVDEVVVGVADGDADSAKFDGIRQLILDDDRDGDMHVTSQDAAITAGGIEPEDWHQLFDASKPARLLYALTMAGQMLESPRRSASLASYRASHRIVPSVYATVQPSATKLARTAQPPKQLVEAEDTVRRAWLRRFVSCGGVAHLIGVVNSLVKRLPSSADTTPSVPQWFGSVGVDGRAAPLAVAGEPAPCFSADVLTVVAINRALFIISNLATAAAVATLPHGAANFMRDFIGSTSLSWRADPAMAAFHSPAQVEALSARRSTTDERFAKRLADRPARSFPQALVDSVLATRFGHSSSIANMVRPCEAQLTSQYPHTDPLYLAVVLGKQACEWLSWTPRGAGFAALVQGSTPAAPAAASLQGIRWGHLLGPASAAVKLLGRSVRVAAALKRAAQASVWASSAMLVAGLLDPATIMGDGDTSGSSAAAAAMAVAAPASLRSMLPLVRAAVLRSSFASSTAFARVALSNALVGLARHSAGSSGVETSASWAIANSLLEGRPTSATADASAAAASQQYFAAAVDAVNAVCELPGLSPAAVDSLFGAHRDSLVAQILSSPARESRESTKADRPLSGALSLLSSILKAGTFETRAAVAAPRASGGQGLLSFVLETGLLAVPSAEQLKATGSTEEGDGTALGPAHSAASGTPVSAAPPLPPGAAKPPAESGSRATATVSEAALLAPPLCKTPVTRSAAFGLVSALVSGNPAAAAEASQVLQEELSEAEKDGSLKVTGFRFNPFVDAKSATGYVGLKNPGCVCYMNSLMQQLFMIEPMRYGLLRLDTGADGQSEADRKENLVWQLQRMFGHLESSERRAFHPQAWCHAFKDMDGNPTSTWIQMDAQEYLTAIVSRLEDRLRSTPSDGLMAACLGGREVSVLSRADGLGEARMASPTPFVTIACNVRGVGSLDSALDRYVAADRIGDYRWSDEEDGSGGERTDVFKRTCIERLSHSVIFQLLRFELDYETFERVKVNDRFDFPEEVDLFPYTAEGVAWKDALQARREAAASRAAAAAPQTEVGAPAEAEAGAAASEPEASGELAPEAQADAAAEEDAAGNSAPASEAAAGAEAVDDVPAFEDESARPYTAERPAAYYKYKLVGVVVHLGSAESGHYYSFIRERGRRAQVKASSRVSKLRYNAAASARENSRALKMINRLLSKKLDEDEDEDDDEDDEEDEDEAADEDAPLASHEDGAAARARSGSMQPDATKGADPTSAAAAAAAGGAAQPMWMGQWFEFNDALVQPTTLERVQEESFGSSDTPADGFESSTNAYMLVYERACELPVETEVDELKSETWEAVPLTEEEAAAVQAAGAASNDTADAKAKGAPDGSPAADSLAALPRVLAEQDPPEDGVLVRVAGEGEEEGAAAVLSRWKRKRDVSRVTKRLSLQTMSPRDSVSGEGSMPSLVSTEVVDDNRRYVRQRHLFDPALSSFVETLARCLVSETLAVRVSGRGAKWHTLPAWLEHARASQGAAAAAAGAAAASGLPLALEADRAEAGRIEELATRILDAGALAFPPAVSEAELAEVLQRAGVDPSTTDQEAVDAAVKAEDVRRGKARHSIASALVAFGRDVWSRSRHATQIKPFLADVASLLGLEPRLGVKAVETMLKPMHRLANLSVNLVGQSAIAVAGGKTTGCRTLHGLELHKAAYKPLLLTLLIECSNASVRAAWSNLLRTVLLSSERQERLKLLSVASEEQTTMLGVPPGDPPIRFVRWFPATFTGRIVEQLCHPLCLDIAAVSWNQWDGLFEVLIGVGAASRQARELLCSCQLPVVLMDTILSKVSPIHGDGLAFTNRSRPLFANKRTGAKADFTSPTRLLSMLIRSHGPPGYYLSSLGLAATTILTGVPETDRALTLESQRRCLEIAHAASQGGAEAKPPTPAQIDADAGALLPIQLGMPVYNLLSNTSLWLQLFSRHNDQKELARLLAHASYGATLANAATNITAAVVFAARDSVKRDASRAGWVAHQLETLFRLPDGMSRSRAKLVMQGQAGTEANPVSCRSMPQLAFALLDLNQDAAFELAWAVVRLARSSKTALRALAESDSLAELEFILQAFEQNHFADMADSCFEPIGSERSFNHVGDAYSAIYTEMQSGGKPIYSAWEEASLIRRARVRRGWRARHMLALLGTRLAEFGVVLRGKGILELDAEPASDMVIDGGDGLGVD